MIIDAHQHVNWHGKNVHGLIADMDANGIDKAWLLNWDIAPNEDIPQYHGSLNPQHLRPDGTHPGIPFSDCIKAKELYPDRFILGYAPHPIYGDAEKYFESAVKIHGVKVCGELKVRMLIDDPRCINLFRKAGELGCPVTVHLDIPYVPDGNGGYTYCPLWYLGTVENLERVLAACPETNFLGHAPGFWREISGDADSLSAGYPKTPVTPGGKLYRILDQYNNLYLDLSAGSGLWALKRDPQHAAIFLKRYSDRILFARDYYGSDLLDFLNTLDLPQEVQNKMYFGNAMRLITHE
jgi:predicted TIM-barrel fold metal-dependent hydrolase